MRKLPVSFETIGHGGGKVRSVFPSASILDCNADGTVFVKHGRAILVVVGPVLAPVRSRLIPCQPRPSLPVNRERRVCFKARRFRDLLDRGRCALSRDISIEDVVVSVLIAIPR